MAPDSAATSHTDQSAGEQVNPTNAPISEDERAVTREREQALRRPFPWVAIGTLVVLAALAVVAALTAGAQFAIPVALVAVVGAIFVGVHRALAGAQTRHYDTARPRAGRGRRRRRRPGAHFRLRPGVAAGLDGSAVGRGEPVPRRHGPVDGAAIGAGPAGLDAVERTRTSTGLPPRRPERRASANSATTARPATIATPRRTPGRCQSPLLASSPTPPLSSRGLGRRPLTAETGVRIPVAVLQETPQIAGLSPPLNLGSAGPRCRGLRAPLKVIGRSADDAGMALVRMDPLPRPSRIRCSCDDCGAHVLAEVAFATLGGSCSNCGSYQLTPVSSHRRQVTASGIADAWGTAGVGP